MSHLSLRTNQEDESHLQFLEQALGVDRSEATRRALSIAVEYLHQQKPDKLQILRDSEFIGADDSKDITRIGFRQSLKAKWGTKYGKKK